MRILRWLYHRWRWRWHQSYRVTYPDGKRTHPLRIDVAQSLVSLYGGRIDWARDSRGNLLD